METETAGRERQTMSTNEHDEQSELQKKLDKVTPEQLHGEVSLPTAFRQFLDLEDR